MRKQIDHKQILEQLTALEIYTASIFGSLIHGVLISERKVTKDMDNCSSIVGHETFINYLLSTAIYLGRNTIRIDNEPPRGDWFHDTMEPIGVALHEHILRNMTTDGFDAMEHHEVALSQYHNLNAAQK